MSDDFAICNKCGCFDCESTPIEQLKFDMLKAIFKHCTDNSKTNFKDIEPEVEELVLEYNKILEEEEKGMEGICEDCGQYTTLSWKHYSYHNENTAHFP